LYYDISGYCCTENKRAPGSLGLVEEMIQATVDIRIEWLIDLCNDIIREGYFPEDWKSKCSIANLPM